MLTALPSEVVTVPNFHKVKASALLPSLVTLLMNIVTSEHRLTGYGGALIVTLGGCGLMGARVLLNMNRLNYLPLQEDVGL